MKLLRSQTRIMLSWLILTFLSLPLHAQEEPAVIKAFYDTFAEVAGERPTHKELAIGSDGAITITGLNIVLYSHQLEGEDIRQQMTIGTATFKGVSELDSGLFEVSEVDFRHTDISLSSPTVTVFSGSIPVLQMTGAIIRGPELIKTALDRWLASNILARTVTLPLITIKMDQWSVDIHDMAGTWNGDARTGLGEWTFTVGSIKLPDEAAKMAEGPMSLQDLGYDTVDAGLAGRSSIALNDDLIDIDMEFSLILKKMGTFTFGGGLKRIQPVLIQTAQTLRDAPETVDMNNLMAQSQTIEIEYFKLRYDDASLVGRILAHQEKTEGKTREQLIEEAVQGSELGLMAFNSPELAAQTRDALRAFLQNPGWLQFEARPTQPVSVSKLMELVGAPPEVIKLLGISVTSGPPAAAQE